MAICYRRLFGLAAGSFGSRMVCKNPPIYWLVRKASYDRRWWHLHDGLRRGLWLNVYLLLRDDHLIHIKKVDGHPARRRISSPVVTGVNVYPIPTRHNAKNDDEKVIEPVG